MRGDRLAVVLFSVFNNSFFPTKRSNQGPVKQTEDIPGNIVCTALCVFNTDNCTMFPHLSAVRTPNSVTL